MKKSCRRRSPAKQERHHRHEQNTIPVPRTLSGGWSEEMFTGSIINPQAREGVQSLFKSCVKKANGIEFISLCIIGNGN
jgi:hypothetical protein